MTIGNRQPIIHKNRDIFFDRLSDIGNSSLFGLALTDAARQTGALGNPITVFTRMENYLTHYFTFLFGRQGSHLFRLPCHVSAEDVPKVTDKRFTVQKSLPRRTGERYTEGVKPREDFGVAYEANTPYPSVRYTYRMSQIPYSVGVVLPKTFLTALSRSESVV